MASSWRHHQQLPLHRQHDVFIYQQAPGHMTTHVTRQADLSSLNYINNDCHNRRYYPQYRYNCNQQQQQSHSTSNLSKGLGRSVTSKQLQRGQPEKANVCAENTLNGDHNNNLISENANLSNTNQSGKLTINEEDLRTASIVDQTFQSSSEEKIENGHSLLSETDSITRLPVVREKTFADVVAASPSGISSEVKECAASDGQSNDNGEDEKDDDDDFEDAIGSNSDDSIQVEVTQREFIGNSSADSAMASENGDDDNKTEASESDGPISNKATCSTVGTSKRNPPVVIKDIPARFKKLLKAAAEKATAQRLRVEGVPLIRHYPSHTGSIATNASGYIYSPTALKQDSSGSMSATLGVPQYSAMMEAQQTLYAPTSAYQPVQVSMEVQSGVQSPLNQTESAIQVDSKCRSTSESIGQTDASGCYHYSSSTSQKTQMMVSNSCVPVIPNQYGQMAYYLTTNQQYPILYTSEDGGQGYYYAAGYNPGSLYVDQTQQQQHVQQQFIQQLPQFSHTSAYLHNYPAAYDTTMAY